MIINKLKIQSINQSINQSIALSYSYQFQQFLHNLLEHSFPSPMKPGLQVHVYDPIVLEHSASKLQSELPVSHSLISIKKRDRISSYSLGLSNCVIRISCVYVLCKKRFCFFIRSSFSFQKTLYLTISLNLLYFICLYSA